MRRLLIGLCLIGMMPSVEAKQLIVSKTGKNVNQLHEELLVAFPQWGAVLQPNGQKLDPGLLRVESTETEIRLTVPENADQAAIQAVISAHVPKAPPPNPDAELKTAITNATTLQELKDALLGKTSQGKVKAERP